MQVKNHMTTVLLLLLGLSLVRGVIYSAIAPPWQAPDEFRHFEYIKLLSQERHLLTARGTSLALQKEIIASMIKHDYWRFGYFRFPFDPKNPPQSFKEIIWPADPYWLFHPPLYYTLGAISLALLGQGDIDLQLYVVRFISVILGTLVILVAFLTAKQLFPKDDSLVIAIPAFIVFLPMHTFIMGAVNNDNLAELLVSLFIFVLTKILKDGLSPLRIASAALLIVLGLLTKRTAILGIPVLATAVLLYFWEGGFHFSFNLSKKGAGLLAGIVILVVLSGILSWEASPGLWKSFLSALRPYLILIPGADFSKLFTSKGITLLALYVQSLFESFWGRFGWMKIRLDPIWYRTMALVSMAAIVGMNMFVIRAFRKRRALALWQKKCLLLFFLCVVFAIVIAMFYGVRVWAHFQSFQPTERPKPQGRYLFPAIIPIATLFTLGLRELAPIRYHKLWLLACVGGFIIFDSISLIGYIIPFFYG